MDEPYRVEVLHIVNPHVIFLESRELKNEPVIEQVGLYGVLPVSKTIDIDGEIQVERCENWPIAANTILREVLASERYRVYFKPVEVDERSTIFDKKVYKFGDLIIESRSSMSLAELLIDTAVAVRDESTFLQKLKSGNLKLKLNTDRTEEVLNAIKTYYKKHSKADHDWQETLNRQTVLHQTKKQVTAKLTKENLKLLDLNYSDRDINKIVEMKEKDLAYCQDAELVSAGCGQRRPNSNKLETPSSSTNKTDKNSPRNLLNSVKLLLDVHKRNSDSNVAHKSDSESIKVQHSTPKQNDNRSNQIIVNDSDNEWDEIQEKHEAEIETDTKLKERNENLSEPYSQRINTKAEIETVGVKANKKQEQKMNQNTYEEYEDDSCQKSSPVKTNKRHIVYCPDMVLSTDNVKNLVPITVSERSPENFANTIEDPINDMDRKNDKVSSLDDKFSQTNISGKGKILNDFNETDEETGDICNYEGITKSDEFCNKVTAKNNVGSSVSHNLTKTSTTNSCGRLNMIQLKEKLQALKMSQNDSLSSKSDSSCDQIDHSSNDSKNIGLKENESHLTSNVKSSQNKNVKNSSRFLKSSILQAKLQLVQEPNVTKDEPNLAQVEPTFIQNEESTLDEKQILLNEIERNVNPFKNLEGSKSVFVENLVSPTLMVHTKNKNLVLPKCELSDIPFKPDIRVTLRAMRIQKVKRLQTVTWNYILRGHSMFIIGPSGNGKTLGYVPAVCNLICDARTQLGLGPICIIVCATALSVSNIENLCKRLLSIEDKIVAFYPGIDPAKVRVSLLNGCSLLICTAPALVKLLEMDTGVDLRRLGILVFDDCERLSQVYLTEIQKITQRVNLMLKNRADKALKVQYVVASRLWCDFMTPLAKQAPNTIIAIGASQECVLYSKTYTSVNIVNSDEKKMDCVLEFLEQIDSSKRTVIVCRKDEEVDALAAALKEMRFTVFSCNNMMTLHDLYNLSAAWNSYKEPISGPILICCDGNLTHLNITNANYLVHYSLPSLFSVFCKRFLVLIENYASIFAPHKSDVKIKILMDKTNVEQLPKILHFVKRCANDELPNLDDVLQDVMIEKDLKKAESLTPMCNSLLMLGDCADVWNCNERHTVFDKFDALKDWMPKNGVITFQITSFETAVTYSARILSVKTKSETVTLPNNLNTVFRKMGMHYSKETNRKLHGKPNVGDVCAVATKQSLFERCRVLKVIASDRKNNYHVLINLLDKEQMQIVPDVELYYIPEDLKAIETYVVQVRLANIQPKDMDVTFSEAAQEHLQKLVEADGESGLYMRGKVAMSLGNCIFIDTAEACVDLSNMGDTIVKGNFKHELLGRHAEPNPCHIDKLKKLCGIVEHNDQEVKEKPKILPHVKNSPKWAHLDADDFMSVYISNIIDAERIFLNLSKFDKLITSLQKDIAAYVENAPQVDKDEIFVGKIVLAEFPDDNKSYERARIDEVIDSKHVKCFFVDNGDWMQVSIDKLKPITENFLHRIPFQSIECRLVGVKPPGNAGWPEFSTSWLDDCIEDKEGYKKEYYVKYFTKEPATVTGGHKYGIVVIDTNSDQDVVINQMMIELNLAKEIVDEIKYIDEASNITSVKATEITSDDDLNDNNNTVAEQEKSAVNDLVPVQKKIETNTTNNIPLNILLGKPIRSVPLVNSDSESDIFDKWDVNVNDDMMGFLGKPYKANLEENKHEKNVKTSKNNTAKITEIINSNDKGVSDSNSETNSSLLTTNNNKSQTSTKLSLDSDDIDIEEDKNKASDSFTRKIDANKSLREIVSKKTVADNNEKLNSQNDTLDSDDLSSVAQDQTLEGTVDAIDVFRKPKIVWRQNKNSVTMKINLIGVEDYILEIKDRQIKFETWHNDTQYGVELELYGAVLPQKCEHSNRGQYIYVSLVKMLPRNWLSLTKDFSTKKWIVYDVDAVGSSSDDNSDDNNDDARKQIKYIHEKNDSASDEDDMMDDLNFTYKNK